ncbi:MAG: PqqD family protein [bacterium]
MTTDHRKPSIPSNVLWREEDGNTVLFDEQNGEPYLLNETGARIWELCNEDVPLGEILSLLPQEFEGDTTVIQKQAMDLIQDLVEKKLLELSAG